MDSLTHKWLNKSRDRFKDSTAIYFAPDIPREKFDVLSKFSKNLSYQDALILIDDTVFGGSKDGVIISKNIFFSHGILEDSGKSVHVSSELEIHIKPKLLTNEMFIDNNIFYDFSQFKREEIVFLVGLMQEICSWKKNKPSTKTSNLLTDCRSCGAPLNYSTCDYCGQIN